MVTIDDLAIEIVNAKEQLKSVNNTINKDRKRTARSSKPLFPTGGFRPAKRSSGQNKRHHTPLL